MPKETGGSSNEGNNFDIPHIPLEGEDINKFRPTSFDEVLRTAGAMVERDEYEDNLRDSFLKGEPEPKDAIDREFDRVKASTLLLRVANPDAVVDNKQIIRGLVENGDLASAIIESSDEQVPIEEAHSVADYAVERALSMRMIEDDELAEDFKLRFDKSQEIATENECTIADVLKNDELFGDLTRRLHTPEEIASSYTNLGEGGKEIAREFLDSAIRPHQLMRRDQIWEQALSIGEETGKSSAIFKIVRFWGAESLESLSDEHKAKLGIDEELISRQLTRGAPVRGSQDQRKTENVLRTAFAKQFFVKNGWDYNSPKADQIKTLQNQPSWIRPLG